MQTALYKFENTVWNCQSQTNFGNEKEVQLVLCFAPKSSLKTKKCFALLKEKFPTAHIASCSTAGQILNQQVTDENPIALAVQFKKSTIQAVCINCKNYENSYEAGKELIKNLPKEKLVSVFVISDGSLVNGSELVKGLNESADNKILITGGLAGDDANFVSTLVGLNEQPTEGNIVAIGFYGDFLKVTHGSKGGWDMFGPERTITKSEGNKLYEIDHKNALELYKKYLGEDAEKLPSSALLFPLSLVMEGSETPIVRTILSIDEKEGAMVFAGEVPQGSKARFMKANFDKLTTAAGEAANQSLTNENIKPQFSLLVSCVGRKLIFGHRIEEEVETVAHVLGDETVLAGFYSYGEISPFHEEMNCQLHNQTMTITSFYEL